MQPSLIRRIRFTPLRDLMRGRLTGRLDVMRHINAAPLPVQAKERVQRIVLRSGLWQREKFEVANELIAHFTDGIEKGASVDELIESFGDERNATKLIRRAKKRNQPFAWHVLRAFGWLTAAMAVIYMVLAVRFLIGRPSPTVNYIEMLNRDIESIPVDQRAWPLYRDAIVAMKPKEVTREQAAAWDGLSEWEFIQFARPGGKRWPMLVDWLERHADSLELVRQAAGKPKLGFVLGNYGSINDPMLWPRSTAPADQQTGLHEPVVALRLQHLQALGTLAMQLAADARLAQEERDAPRLARNIESIWNMAEQMRGGEPFLIFQQCALGVTLLAFDELASVLNEAPDLLTDEKLRNWAHRLSQARTAADLYDLDSSRFYLYDEAQRIYTDDGKGNGRITYEGMLRVLGMRQYSHRDAQLVLQHR